MKRWMKALFNVREWGVEAWISLLILLVTLYIFWAYGDGVVEVRK